ncbi:hypothetical protein B566_EDAN003090 [Ephemera danica]|nr:hypothetical protein B566_EDAN003090 [Ephemera danica]
MVQARLKYINFEVLYLSRNVKVLTAAERSWQGYYGDVYDPVMRHSQRFRIGYHAYHWTYDDGKLAGIGPTEVIGFISTPRNWDLDYPDLQFHHLFGDVNASATYINAIGYNAEIQRMMMAENLKHPILMVSPTLLRPKSRDDDLMTMLDGVRYAIQFGRTSVMRQLGAQLVVLSLLISSAGVNPVMVPPSPTPPPFHPLVPPWSLCAGSITETTHPPPQATRTSFSHFFLREANTNANSPIIARTPEIA